jgi:UDP-4-amino-4,6-dideoxy-N-acetyl-beta-L-altrosamine N-acetyltransferase
MYTRHEISATEHKAWWKRTRQREDQQYYMYDKAGDPLGIVAFTMIDPANSNCSWAFYAAPGAPRGTGSSMEFLALEHAFGTMQLHKLFCEVLAFNSAVIRLHLKFGFQVEGTFRAQHKMNDDYVDIVRLGMLAPEWAAMREEILVGLTAAANGATP